MSLIYFINNKIDKYKKKYLKLKIQTGNGVLWNYTEEDSIATKIDITKIKWFIKWNILLFIYIILEPQIDGQFKIITDSDKKLVFNFFANDIDQYLWVAKSSRQFFIHYKGDHHNRNIYPHITSIHDKYNQSKNWHYTKALNMHLSSNDDIIPLVEKEPGITNQLILFGILYIVDSIIDRKDLIRNALFFAKFYSDNISKIELPYIDDVLTQKQQDNIEANATIIAKIEREENKPNIEKIINERNLSGNEAKNLRRRLSDTYFNEIKDKSINNQKNNFNTIESMVPFIINFKDNIYKEYFIRIIEINITEYIKFIPEYKRRIIRQKIKDYQKNIEENEKKIKTIRAKERSVKSKKVDESEVIVPKDSEKLEEENMNISIEISNLEKQLKLLE